jgi:hypothetical protein
MKRSREEDTSQPRADSGIQHGNQWLEMAGDFPEPSWGQTAHEPTAGHGSETSRHPGTTERQRALKSEAVCPHPNMVPQAGPSRHEGAATSGNTERSDEPGHHPNPPEACRGRGSRGDGGDLLGTACHGRIRRGLAHHGHVRGGHDEARAAARASQPAPRTGPSPRRARATRPGSRAPRTM